MLRPALVVFGSLAGGALVAACSGDPCSASGHQGTYKSYHVDQGIDGGVGDSPQHFYSSDGQKTVVIGARTVSIQYSSGGRTVTEVWGIR